MLRKQYNKGSVTIKSLEQTRYLISEDKPNDTLYYTGNKGVYTPYFTQFAHTAAICMLAVCLAVPVVNACSIASTLNITDNVHIVETPAEGVTVVQRSELQPLSTTVFGTQYTASVLNAIDVQAYNTALAYETEIQTRYNEEIARMRDAERFYIPEITLEYEAEKMYVPYDTQKYIWDTCNELDLDYFLVMGIIARESRFQLDITSCTNGVTYYGGMQVSGAYWQEMCATVGGDVTTMTYNNVQDNLWVGMHFLAYCIEQTGSEYAGVMAYGMGFGAYRESIANGNWYDSVTEKAYKYRELLLQNTRYVGTETGVIE